MTDTEHIVATHEAGVVAEVQSMALGILDGSVPGLRNLRNLRRQKYGTQKAICYALGFDRGTYNSWETCRHWPKADALLLLAAALECTVEDLCRDPDLPGNHLKPEAAP